jgi:hypothetical protein
MLSQRLTDKFTFSNTDDPPNTISISNSITSPDILSDNGHTIPNNTTDPIADI